MPSEDIGFETIGICKIKACPLTRVVLAVPIKKDAERIGRCLLAQLEQQQMSAASIELVLNNIADDTTAYIRDVSVSTAVPVEVIEHNFLLGQASAGAARGMGMEQAVELADVNGALMTTDTDGRVPLD